MRKLALLPILITSAAFASEPIGALRQSLQVTQSPLASPQLTLSLRYNLPQGVVSLVGPSVTPGQTGSVDLPIPPEFAAEIRNCSNQSLYYVITSATSSNNLGRTEGPHPTLASWGLGRPDFGWAYVDFARIHLHLIHFDTQSSRWTADATWEFWGTSRCYANCDRSCTHPMFNVDDFTCFINEFAQAQSLPHEQQVPHYANCDDSTTAPVLNVDDFTCFINAFAAGCP